MWYLLFIATTTGSRRTSQLGPVATRSRRPTWGEAFPKTDQVGSRAPPTEGFWNSSYPGRDACTVLIQKRYLTEETDMVPARVLARIATWRRLTEDERVSRLRECIVDEVVGNMRMEGQPVSAAWEAAARGDGAQRVYQQQGACSRVRGLVG